MRLVYLAPDISLRCKAGIATILKIMLPIKSHVHGLHYDEVNQLSAIFVAEKNVDPLVQKLADLDEMTKTLQRTNTTMRYTHIYFDTFVVDYTDLAA